jgi:SAM-dependent methyltransferase
MWDVLEHLADPRAALRRVHELLRPSGVLAVGTPHRHGVTLRAFGARALLVVPPEHLLLASSDGLRAAATDAGFEVVRLVTVDIHLRQWTSWARGRGDVEARSAAGPADDRVAFLSTYRRITESAAFGAVQAAANAVLRATHLGDQLFALLRRANRG